MGVVFALGVLALALSAQLRKGARDIARDGTMICAAVCCYFVATDGARFLSEVEGRADLETHERGVLVVVAAGAVIALAALFVRSRRLMLGMKRATTSERDRERFVAASMADPGSDFEARRAAAEARRLALVELERKFVAAWGTKVLVLAALTLVPFAYGWRVHGSLNITLAGLVFIAYHGVGFYIWIEVRHVRGLDGIPSLRFVGEERIDRLVRLLPWERRWRVLGYLVWPLLALSLVRAVRIAGFSLLPRDSLHWLV